MDVSILNKLEDAIHGGTVSTIQTYVYEVYLNYKKVEEGDEDETALFEVGSSDCGVVIFEIVKEMMKYRTEIISIKLLRRWPIKVSHTSTIGKEEGIVE